MSAITHGSNIQDYLKNKLFQVYITCFSQAIICVLFYINVWIYCSSYVKQLGKLKINLV
jgi:hypothetical protein